MSKVTSSLGVSQVLGGGGSDAAGDAADAQVASSTAAIAEDRRQFNKTQANLRPFLKAGQRALIEQRSLLGLNGEGRQQNAFDRFTESPGQAFLRERGERALLQNQAAIGGLGGGNVRSALQEQGIGFAQQDYNNYLAQLGGMTGMGTNTATTLGTIGANTASNIGQNLMLAGDARSSGILGAQQADAARTQNLFSLGTLMAASDERLKDNIEKIGTHESGLGWYRWEWNEEGKRVAGSDPAEGFIAQEVQKLYPAAIGEREGYLTVDYRRVA